MVVVMTPVTKIMAVIVMAVIVEAGVFLAMFVYMTVLVFQRRSLCRQRYSHCV